ncbi:MAG: MBL fold metallo-hydrolase [Candidatus Methanofastidiosia archaeon]
MRVLFLGTRGNIEPWAPWHSLHAGILVDDFLLLDLGEKEYLQYNPRCILVTHLHPDHAVFVKEDISIHVPVYAPELCSRVSLIKVLSSAVTVGEYYVEPIPVVHSVKVKSQALIVEKEKRILYTSDMAWIEEKYHQEFGDLDLVITDGSFMRTGGMIRKEGETGRIYGHTGIPDLVHLFKEYTDHIVFTHFGSWFYRDIMKARETIRQVGNAVTVEAVRDNQEMAV